MSVPRVSTGVPRSVAISTHHKHVVNKCIVALLAFLDGAAVAAVVAASTMPPSCLLQVEIKDVLETSFDSHSINRCKL